MPKGTPDKGYAMTPAREKIMRYLLDSGGVHDDTGRAVEALREITGHSTTNALSGVLKAMEDADLIRRHVIGRRTYSIEANPDALAPEDAAVIAPAPKKLRGKLTPAPVAEAEPSITDDVDYDLLAGVLLKKALLATQAQESSAGVKTLQEKLARAEAQVQYFKDAAEALRSEVAELKATIKTLEHNNKVLSNSMDKVRNNGGVSIKDMISASELRDLDKLMKALPTKR